MPVTDLRPLSIGELLDKTFSIYRSHFWLFVGIMAVPGLIPFAMGTFAGVIGSMDANSGAPAPASVPFIVATTLIFLLAYGLAYAMALAATVFAVSDVHLGQETTILRAFGRVRGRSLRTLWMLIALMLAMGLGFMFLIVPGVLVAVWYSVAIPAAIIENLKSREAFRRSENLTKGRRGSIFLIFVLFIVLNYVAMAIFEVPAALLQGFWPGVTSLVIGNLATFASGALAGPLLTISLSLMYYDLRVRKEGFDLQFMLSSLGSTAPATAPS